MLRETKKNFLIDFVFLLTVGAIIYFVIKFLLAYLLPFVIGLVIAVLVQKPTAYISRHTRVPKGICSIILVILTYAVVASLLSFIVYLIYSFGAKIAAALPYIFDELVETWNIIKDSFSELMIKMPGFAQNSAESIITDLIVDAGKKITGWLPGFAASVALSTPDYIIITTVTIVASCYFAKDFDRIRSITKKFLKPKYREIANEIKDIAFTNIFKLIKSYAVILSITFVELSIGLLIIGIDNALLIALLIAIVDILPVLGCGTVLIPWGIISLIQGNFFMGIGLLVLYVIILVIRNVVEPKIVGVQVGMHPLITLLAIFVGYRFVGLLGVFILPIVTIILIELYKRGKLSLDLLFSK